MHDAFACLVSVEMKWIARVSEQEKTTAAQHQKAVFVVWERPTLATQVAARSGKHKG